jgi:Fe-S-cluster-containing hydrogenase component 2
MAAKVDHEKCTGCGECVAVCPQGAISIVNEVAVIDSDRCSECGRCYHACPSSAIYAETESVQQFPQNQNGMFSVPAFDPRIGGVGGLGMGRGRGLRRGPRNGRGRGRGGGGRKR